MNRPIITLGLLGVLLLAACAQYPVPTDNTDVPTVPAADADGIVSITTSQELTAYLQEHRSSGATSGYGPMAFARGMVVEEMAMDAAAPSAAPLSGGSADEYSTTNVQVAGIDEADVVKNDGGHIYTLVDDDLVIVDAFPAKDMDIVSQTPLEGRPQALFLDGDTVYVISVVEEERETVSDYDFTPTYTYEPVTLLSVFDVADREDPEIIDEVRVDGRYSQSRLKDGEVYLITQDDVDYGPIVPMPLVRTAEGIVRPDVYGMGNPEDQFVFHTLLLYDDGAVDSASYLLGWSTTLYMSHDNLYLAYQKRQSWWRYQEDQLDRFFEVVVPLLPSDVRGEVSGKDDWSDIKPLLEEMYQEMATAEQEALADAIEEALAEHDAARAAERDTTVVARIDLDTLELAASGDVRGTLLNQFSLDEDDGHLRVATTTNVWTRRDWTRHNNVYVLDSDMDVVGSLEGLAEDESIFAARFIGERLYLVTFERIDPLFVIDLSRPTRPRVLGELKIPGFSQYLHPYDEDHLIGIGKEADLDGRTQGIKVSLYDVSDVSAPKEVDTYEIGDSGSDSPALRDHKAFLFDTRNDLVVIPVSEVSGGEWRRNRDVWQGAYVLEVSPALGIRERGTVTHRRGTSDEWWWSPDAIYRSLYVDDTLYTLSHRKIQANSIDSLGEISEVRLPYSGDGYQRWY